MRVVLLTNNPVRLSFAEAALRAEGVTFHTLDASTSAVEGSIGAIPRRLVVSAEDEEEFVKWLRGVFNSEQTKKIVGALTSQSKA